MTKIEDIIRQAESLYKSQVKASTYVAHKRAFGHFLETATRCGFNNPCQELYDIFLRESRDPNQRYARHRAVKLADALAQTQAIEAGGLLINEPPLPDPKVAQAEVADYVSGMRNNLSFDCLIVATIEAINLAGTTKSTLGQYIRVCRMVRSALIRQGIVDYDHSVLQRLREENDQMFASGKRIGWKWKIYRRTIHILEDVAVAGEFKWHVYRVKESLPEPEMEEIRQAYTKTLSDRQLERTTIGLHNYVFRRMVEFGNIQSPERLKEIDRDDVIGICESLSSFLSPRSRMTVFPIFRAILEHLHDTGHVRRRLSGCVLTTNGSRGNVAAYIPREQEAALLECAHRANHLRDRAILILGYRLALRDVDICNLRLSDIDWKNDRIWIIQKKTGVPLALPLLDEVGNALMDYIVDERPKDTGLPYVFLRHVKPYAKLTSIYHTVRHIQDAAGIVPSNGGRKGPHLFRYSLAYRLQKANVPYQTITDALGHTSKESDKPYLAMDAPMLKKCSLGLDLIGMKTWKQ